MHRYLAGAFLFCAAVSPFILERFDTSDHVVTSNGELVGGDASPSAKLDYMLHCQGCHLPQGEGFPTRDVPRLKGELGKFLSVDGGRDFLVQVPGSALSDLDDERLAGVLNWMLVEFSPNELPSDFVPFQADEVARLRRTPLIEVSALRASLVSRFEPETLPSPDTTSHGDRDAKD